MIRKILLTLLLFCAGFCMAQSFTAKYNFAFVSANCVNNCTVDPTPVPIVPGISFDSFSASGTASSPNASGRFSFQDWPTGSANGVDTYSIFTGSLSPSAYYEVTLIPQPGYTLSLSEISFRVRRSGTGIRNYAVRSNLDGYLSNLTANTGSNTNLSVVGTNIFFWNFDATSTAADQVGSRILPDSTFSGLTDTVSFRFYAWNSEGSLGTFSIDSVVFSGLVYNTLPVATNLRVIKDQENQLGLFPNPSPDGRMTLESDKDFLKVEVLSCFGIVIFQLEIVSPKRSAELDLSLLPAGVYFIKTCFSEGKNSYKRLVIYR